MKTTILTFILALVALVGMGQTLHSKHKFTNTGFSDDEITVIKIRYSKTDKACDTLFIGKEVHYFLCGASWNGWTKWDKIPPNASISDGYTLCQETNPKDGRAIKPNKSDWYWIVYLDQVFGKRLIRITHVNFKTNQYIAYLK